jgi:integrase
MTALALRHPTPPDPVTCYIDSLAEGSRRVMRQSLRIVAETLGHRGDLEAFAWGDLRYADTSAVAAQLRRRYQPATAARHVTAMKMVLREAWRLDLIPDEAFRRAVDLRPIPVPLHAVGRVLSTDECRRLLGARAFRINQAARDRALLALMLATGIRRSEVCGLDLGDVDLGAGELHIRKAKRDRRRRVPLAAEPLELLMGYFRCRGELPGPLFYAVDQRDRLQARRLCVEAVSFLLRRTGGRAGVSNFCAHDLRRTAITVMLDQGEDPLTVARLVGHADPATTLVYDRRPASRLRPAVERLWRRLLTDPSDSRNGGT